MAIKVVDKQNEVKKNVIKEAELEVQVSKSRERKKDEQRY